MADTLSPGTFFYHLQPGEDPGPLPITPWEILLSVIGNYLSFFIFYLPVVWLFSTPIAATYLLALFNEPAMLALMFTISAVLGELAT